MAVDGKGSIGVRIQVSPSPDRLARAYRDSATEIKDLRQAWAKLLPVAIDESRRTFATRGVSLDGEQWRPLKPAYARYRSFRKGRRKKGKRALAMVGPVNTQATLRLTGKLFAKLTNKSAARITPSSFRFGVYNLPYARAVQFGHGRWFVGVSDRLRVAAYQVITEHVDNMIDRIASKLGKSRSDVLGRAL